MMRQLICAAVLVVGASGAQAATMQAVFTGTAFVVSDGGLASAFDFDPQTLVGQAVTAIFVYDTDLGTRTTAPYEDVLNSSSSDAAILSAVLSIGSFTRTLTSSLPNPSGSARFENVQIPSAYNLFTVGLGTIVTTSGFGRISEQIGAAHYNFGNDVVPQFLDQPFASTDAGTGTYAYYFEERDDLNQILRTAFIGVEYNSVALTVLTDGGDPDPDPEVPVVPLPAGLPLLVGGLGALALLRRRAA
jgi:hypothetical protein